MTKVEIACDRCPKTIGADRSKLVAESGPLRSHPAGRARGVRH